MRDRQNLDQKYLGGPFDRQVRMQSWDQSLIQSQTVLILGVGGLGSATMLNLLRLGIGRLLIVDYDVVDLHNLNRQLMYSRKDVGKSKVQAARDNAQFHNMGDTKIQIFHGCAVKNWNKIVQFAKKSTFVYNCIDYGDHFDAAVTSLCMALKLPLVMGGTFAVSLTVDFFSPQGQPCWKCLDDYIAKSQFIPLITPDKILELQNIAFLPKNNNPIGRSSVVVCTICGEMMVAHLLNWLFLADVKPYKNCRIFFYHNTFQMINFGELESNKNCLFCGKKQEEKSVQAVQVQNQSKIQEKTEENTVKQPAKQQQAENKPIKGTKQANEHHQNVQKASQPQVKVVLQTPSAQDATLQHK